MPPFTSGTKQPLAEPVGGFPEAASWAGIEDLVGSVYQWTDVFSDDHTSRYIDRFMIDCFCKYEGCYSFMSSYIVEILSKTPGLFSGEHLGGIRRALIGTSLCPMALTSQTGRRRVLSSSRTQCSCFRTAWTVPEASVSVVLLRNRRGMNKERLKQIFLFEKERGKRQHFKLSIPSPGQCFAGHHVGGQMEETCSPHGKYLFGITLFIILQLIVTRYQPLPYGTHWTWPDVQWETPGPTFEQNTMLLLSDSMDRLLSFFKHKSSFIQHLALSILIILILILPCKYFSDLSDPPAVQVRRNWIPLRCRCRLKELVVHLKERVNILFM